MKEIKTAVGSLYYEETPVGEYAFLSNNKKVMFHFEDRDTDLEDFIHCLEQVKNWHEFVECFKDWLDCSLMWALTLQELKNEFYDYNVETYNKTAYTKRQSNKIVKNNYVIIGKHYMLFDFAEL